MADLIDRQAVNDALDKTCDIVCQYSKKQRYVMCGACPLGSAYDVIENVPSADAVNVVRCKDCKYCDTGIDEEGNHFLKCLGWVYGGTKEDDYCSHGVRKDG